MKISFAYKIKHFHNIEELRHFFIYGLDKADKPCLVINLRRFVPLCLLVTILVYILITLYIYIKEYDEPAYNISYLDVVNPAKWGSLKDQKALGLIQRGRELISSGKVTEGVWEIRKSLKLAPDKVQMRLKLANYFSNINDNYTAIKLLENEFNLNIFDDSACELFFNLTNATERFNTIIAICETILLKNIGKIKTETGFLIYQNYANALYQTKKYDEVLTFINSLNLDISDQVDLIKHKTLSLLKLNRFKEAIDFVLKNKNKHLKNPEYLQIIATTFDVIGERDVFLETLNEMININPDRLESYLYYVEATFKKDSDAMFEIFEQLINRYKSNNDALIKIANLTAKLPSSLMTQKCLNQLPESISTTTRNQIYFLYLQSLANESKWSKAKNSFAQFKLKMSRKKATLESLLDYQFYNTLFSMSGFENASTELQLRKFLKNYNLNIDFYVEMSHLLRKNDLHLMSKYMTDYAIEIYPESPRIIDEIQIINEVLEYRKRAAERNEFLVNAEMALYHIDDLINEKKYIKVNQFFQLLHLKRPWWINDVKDDLDKMRLTVDYETSDLLYARASTRIYLSGGRYRGPELLDLAKIYKDKKNEYDLLLYPSLSSIETIPKEGHMLMIVAQFPSEYQIQLMQSINNITELPKYEKLKIIIAELPEQIVIRIFNDKLTFIDYETDNMPNKAEKLKQLNNILRPLWKSESLNISEQKKIIDSVLSLTSSYPPMQLYFRIFDYDRTYSDYVESDLILEKTKIRRLKDRLKKLWDNPEFKYTVKNDIVNKITHITGHARHYEDLAWIIAEEVSRKHPELKGLREFVDSFEAPPEKFRF